MPALLTALLAVLGGYLLGSIPTGYWVGRWWGGIDIRQQGSGSTGATNVLRTLGKGPALLVLLVDAAKGAAAVALGSALGSAWWVVLAALFAVIGHSRSCWLGFRGGKSVATSLGILLAMAWPVALTTFGVWLLGLALTRIVSFSSLLAAVAAPGGDVGNSSTFALFVVCAGGRGVCDRCSSRTSSAYWPGRSRVLAKMDAISLVSRHW